MIDIHTHVLPLVDDGSDNLKASIAMLEESCKQGVTDLFLTPHFRGEFNKTPTQIESTFISFCQQVKQQNIDINLYLGQEVYISKSFKSLFDSDRFLTMNNSNYVLIEFDYQNDFDIAETVYELTRRDYKPIVAHFERYEYADLSVAREIKSLGGYIQINASSIVGKTKKSYIKKIIKLIKEGCVDFIASDVHDFRENFMKKSADFISRKFGKKVANELFYENARKIIKK